MNRINSNTEHERSRRDKARECTAVIHRVTSYNTVWRSRHLGEWHYVEFAEKEMRCDCTDWIRHELPCKHIYSVLNIYGVRTVSEYIAKKESEAMTERIQNAPLKMANARPLVIKGITIE